MILESIFFGYVINELLKEVSTVRYIQTVEYVEVTVEDKIRQTFPENAELMLAIAKCESGLNQDAVSHTGDYGIMQINEASWDKVAEDMDLDYKNSIDDNLELAQHILEVQSETAWVCYNKDMHLAYLK